MNISCDIIRDILPLYAEEVVSEATREMVDEHLCGCDACTKELAQLKKPAQIEEAAHELDSLKRIRKAILLRRVLAVLASVLLVISVVCGVHCYLNGIVPLSADEIDINTEVSEDGNLLVYHKIFRNNGAHSHVWMGTDNYAIMSVLTRKEMLLSEKKEIGLLYLGLGYGTEENGVNLWYVNPETGEPDILLWNAGKPTPAELEPEQDLDIHFSRFPRAFVIAFAVLGVVLSAMALRRRGKKAGNVLSIGAIVCWCQLLSTVVNADAGFQNYNGMVLGEVLHFLAMGTLFSATALCWRKVLKLNRQDKGIQ